MSAEPLLRATEIRAGYLDNLIIEGLDVTLMSGELTLLTGLNGAGKSTLLKSLAGLHPAKFSRYVIDGVDCTPQSRLHKRKTLSITGEWMWMRGMSIAEHLLLLRDADGVMTLEEAVEVLELQELIDRMPFSLSSGQLQRASLAAMLVRPWKVLFLDEPEQRLDTEFQHLLPDLVKRCLPGRAIIAATHAPELFDSVSSQPIELT